jgi:hypothetical protein
MTRANLMARSDREWNELRPSGAELVADAHD